MWWKKKTCKKNNSRSQQLSPTTKVQTQVRHESGRGEMRTKRNCVWFTLAQGTMGYFEDVLPSSCRQIDDEYGYHNPNKRMWTKKDKKRGKQTNALSFCLLLLLLSLHMKLYVRSRLIRRNNNSDNRLHYAVLLPLPGGAGCPWERTGVPGGYSMYAYFVYVFSSFFVDTCIKYVLHDRKYKVVGLSIWRYDGQYISAHCHRCVASRCTCKYQVYVCTWFVVYTWCWFVQQQYRLVQDTYSQPTAV